MRMAKTVLAEVSAEEMVDMDVVRDRAVALAEERGIILLMKSIRLRGDTVHPAGLTYPVKGCSGISFPLWKGRR